MKKDTTEWLATLELGKQHEGNCVPSVGILDPAVVVPPTRGEAGCTPRPFPLTADGGNEASTIENPPQCRKGQREEDDGKMSCLLGA